MNFNIFNIPNSNIYTSKQMNLDFIYKSSDHIRYEGGKRVPGQNAGANRAIKVEPNVNGGEGFTVTLFNLDGNHPVWQNNVQMAPKQMKVIQKSDTKLVLKGYGSDSMGASFEDYGLTIHLTNKQIEKCILHMHDRNVDIEYIKSGNNDKKERILERLAIEAIESVSKNTGENRSILIQLHRTVRNNPAQLKDVENFSNTGKAFLLMIMEKISDDIDNLQMMASVSYLFLSKSIKKGPVTAQHFIDRLLLLYAAHEPFKYTVMAAQGLNENPFSVMAQMAPLKARDTIYRMEVADLSVTPMIFEKIDFF